MKEIIKKLILLELDLSTYKSYMQKTGYGQKKGGNLAQQRFEKEFLAKYKKGTKIQTSKGDATFDGLSFESSFGNYGLFFLHPEGNFFVTYNKDNKAKPISIIAQDTNKDIKFVGDSQNMVIKMLSWN